MKYEIDLYECSADNRARFALGMRGSNPLLAVGLNPSTADDSKPDQSISKLMGFAERNGYDGFIMLNLYPQRTPYPNRLHQRRQAALHAENMRAVQGILNQYPNVQLLAAWGSIIHHRTWLPDCLLQLNKLCEKSGQSWIQIGNGTAAGHPRHPSRASYDLALKPFDIEAYLATLVH